MAKEGALAQGGAVSVGRGGTSRRREMVMEVGVLAEGEVEAEEEAPTKEGQRWCKRRRSAQAQRGDTSGRGGDRQLKGRRTMVEEGKPTEGEGWRRKRCWSMRGRGWRSAGGKEVCSHWVEGEAAAR